MKQLLFKGLLATVMVTASAATHAATIQAYASELLGFSNEAACDQAINTTNCDFVAPGHAVGRAELAATVADANNPDVGSFVFSYFRDSAYIELGFGSTPVVTGPGADLVIFTVGNGYRFGLTVLDNSPTPVELSSFVYSVPLDGSSQAVDEQGNLLSLTDSNGNAIADISATRIFLDGVPDGTEIGALRIFLGNDYNGVFDTNGNLVGTSNLPLFSLAGAYHTTDSLTAVPLPLPALLMGSGLFLLGLFRRR